MNANEWETEMQIRQAIAAENKAESIDNIRQLALEYNETENAKPIFRDGMDFVATYMVELQAMICRLSKRMGREDLAEEVFSDAVIGWCNHAYCKFDPKRNNDLRGWMFAQLQLYARKWFERYYNRGFVQCDADSIGFAELLAKVETQSIADYRREISALLDSEQAIQLLARLDDNEERLVRMHCCYSQTFEEIAEKIGGAPSTLRVAYNATIAKLKRMVSDVRAAEG